MLAFRGSERPGFLAAAEAVAMAVGISASKQEVEIAVSGEIGPEAVLDAVGPTGPVETRFAVESWRFSCDPPTSGEKGVQQLNHDFGLDSREIRPDSRATLGEIHADAIAA